VLITTVFLFTWWLDGRLGLDDRLRALLSAAVSICGVSAAIAAAGAVQARREQRAQSRSARGWTRCGTTVDRVITVLLRRTPGMARAWSMTRWMCSWSRPATRHQASPGPVTMWASSTSGIADSPG
jgi:hypothetical protein